MHICKKDKREWTEIMEGTEFCGLRINEAQGGAALIRMKKGARFPQHTHKSQEETMVLSGAVRIGEQTFVEGDYLYTEKGEQHDVVAQEDVLMYVTVEAGIEVVE